MSKSQGVSAPKPAPIRKTKFVKFFSCNPQQDALFSVNADISVIDALNQASCMLSAAIGTARNAAEEANSDPCWAVSYLVEMSKAAVDAAIGAISKEERGHV